MITVKNDKTGNIKIVPAAEMKPGRAYIYDGFLEEFIKGQDVAIFIGVNIKTKGIAAVSLTGTFISHTSEMFFMEVKAEITMSMLK